ncbi:MAG TPA: tail fiber protein [Allosphingosinicella sp.]|nr:tail fiber protein [Allosphingosinicella sp.]
MGQPYVGEIRMFGGNFAPAGWMFCNGATLPIAENETLFNLIGTTYGGDGQETFQLPDLQGRLPMHAGQGPGLSQTYQLGEAGGVESVTLSTQQIPAHNHAFIALKDIGSGTAPQNSFIAQSDTIKMYAAVNPTSPLGANSVTPTGGSQPHDNFQPYLCISFIISLFGVFPSQT